MSLTKIGSIGINTGIQFAGVTTVSTLHVGSGVTLSSDGDIFATGISTFSEDIKVGSGVTISPDGDVFFTGIATGNGSGLTALNASNLGSGTVPTARLGSGTASSSTFLRGDSSFQTITTDLVGDTSPQLGGNLDVNTKNILFGDSSDGSSDDVLKFGAGSDLNIYHNGTHSFLKNDNGTLVLSSDTISLTNNAGNSNRISAHSGGEVKLYYSDSVKLQTASTGVDVTGTITADGLDMEDSQKILLGTGDDLQIYHDGTDSRIENTTGKLYLKDDYITFVRQADDTVSFQVYEGGSTDLYHNHNLKLQTTSSGISVTGGGTFTDTVHCNSADDTRLRLNVPSGNGDDWNYIGFYGEDGSRDGFLGSWNDGTMSFYDDNNSHYIRFMDGALKTNASYVPVSSNSVDLGTTSLLWRDAFISGGVYLGGTAAANKLYDYEKGTFTPRFHGQGNNNTITTSTNVGEYVRIGRLVHVKLYVVFSNRNGANSVLAMDGLPFANAGNYTAIPLGRWTNMQNCPVIGALTGHIGDGSTEITFHEIQQSGASTSDVNRTTDTTSVMLNFSYPIWSA